MTDLAHPPLPRSAEHDHLLEILTGVKASKLTHYSEYRDKARQLDRAIASLASIGAALANTTHGVAVLAQAMVGVVMEHFVADCAMLVLSANPHERWLACRNEADLPVPARLMLGLEATLQNQQPLVLPVVDKLAVFGAPLIVGEQAVGALAMALRDRPMLDAHEMVVLQTLANQAAVALENAVLYEAVVRQKTELEAKNRQLEWANQTLAQARQHEVINNERNRIARDLHDSVAQHLLSIGMNLEWCRAQLPEASPVYERISSAKTLAREAVTRIRATIFELSTISNETGLLVALRNLIAEFEQTSGLAVGLRVIATPRLLSIAQAHALYHITQEALFNVYKHAQASRAEVVVRFGRDDVQITISDDGVGIAPVKDSPLPGGHYGLRNMQSRAQELGGACTIRRRRGGGTQVQVRIPTQ